MANRRMFAKSIIGSARFLRMPVSARLLYYDLGMMADDEGVVEAYPVMRMTGATDDDLRVLAAKQFVVIMNDDLVTVIKDWRENNYIQKDRFNRSIYHDYAERVQNGYTMDAECIHDVHELETQVRIGKDRLDKDSVVEVADEPPLHETIESFADSSFNGLSPIAMQELESFREDLPDDVIKWAICQAIDSKVKTWFYCKKILNRCIDQGLKTMDDVLKAAEEFERLKEKRKSAQSAPNTRNNYQQHVYKDDADYGVVDMTVEEQKRKADEALEQIKKEHPEWYE